MLPGAVPGRLASTSRNVFARAVSGSMPTTVAVCHALEPGAVPDIGSVALVTLLEPRIAAVVVAVALPEAGFVVVEELEPGDPLRALPEVEVRHDEPGGPAVLGVAAAVRRPPMRPTPSRR